jgi:hypothetical protein
MFTLLALIELIALSTFVRIHHEKYDWADRPQFAYTSHYVAKWYRHPNRDRGGSILEIHSLFEYTGNREADKKALLNRYVSYDYIESVAPWTAPPDNGAEWTGLFITEHYSTGSSRKFLILAEQKGKFRKVFQAFSHRVGEGRSVEWVDLDGDSYPEIITVPSYDGFRGTNPRSTKAQVWKWSDQKARYVMVRESPYLQRLKPLKSK